MEKDREAFEASPACKEQCASLRRHASGVYISDKTHDMWVGWQAALAYAREGQKPVGWFNPWNDVHGYQQVAEEFEGEPGTIPLYAAPPLNVSPPEKD